MYICSCSLYFHSWFKSSFVAESSPIYFIQFPLHNFIIFRGRVYCLLLGLANTYSYSLSFLGLLLATLQTNVRIDSDPTTIQEPYDLILFLGGTNDLGRARVPDDIFADIEKIIAIPLKNGARVVLLTIPECAANVDWLNERRDVLNEMMKKRAEEDENV